MLVVEKYSQYFIEKTLQRTKKVVPLRSGKSYTTSSL